MEKILRYQNQFFFILLGLSFVLVFLIFRPFLTTLIIAIVFSTILYPLYHLIQRPFGTWKSIPAILTIVILLLIIIAPTGFLISRIVTESTQAYTTIGSELSKPDSFIHQTESAIQRAIPSFNIDVDSIIKPLLQTLTNKAGSIFATTISTIINTVIFFIAMFFLLKNGQEIKRWLIDISPLPNIYDGVIIQRLAATMNSVVRGSICVAIIQGIVAGLGFIVFGMPNPTLLGFLTAIASLIPGIGTPIVTLPSAIFLYLSGHPIAGIGMAIWGIIAVSLIDNIVGPQIIGSGKGVNIHSFLILISVLGGLTFFGPWGFILGPVTLSFFLALLDVFSEYIAIPNKKISEQSKRIKNRDKKNTENRK
jgi:predicted PurR-regulated permease PerM